MWAPERFTMPAHLLISDPTRAANCSGVLPTGTSPWPIKRLRISDAAFAAPLRFVNAPDGSSMPIFGPATRMLAFVLPQTCLFDQIKILLLLQSYG